MATVPVEGQAMQLFKQLCESLEEGQLEEFAKQQASASDCDRVAKEVISAREAVTKENASETPAEKARRLSIKQGRIASQIKKAEAAAAAKTEAVQKAKEALIQAEAARDEATVKVDRRQAEQAETAQELAEATQKSK